MKNTGALEDIADKLETDQPLFDQEETKEGVNYNQKILDGDEKHVPQYVEEQINPGLSNMSQNRPDEQYSPGQKTGPRSAKFDYLLDEQ